MSNDIEFQLLQIVNQIYLIDKLVFGFRSIGLEGPARQLEDCSNSLQKSHAALKKLVSDAVFQRFEEAEQSSRNVLAAALAGATVAKNGEI